MILPVLRSSITSLSSFEAADSTTNQSPSPSLTYECAPSVSVGLVQPSDLRTEVRRQYSPLRGGSEDIIGVMLPILARFGWFQKVAGD